MSINIIPGYDFTINELVTRDKLMAWVTGAHNEGTFTLADLGITFGTIDVTATRASAVTEGVMSLDSTHGMICVMSRWGTVPIALTRGGFFTRRIPFDDGDYGQNRNWYTIELALLRDLGVPGAPAFPASSYSAGEHLVAFGAQFDAMCADTLQSAAYMRGVGLWPSEDYWASGLSSNSAATMFQPLLAFGGWVPVLATCATNGFTAPYVSSPSGKLISQGSVTYQTVADTVIKFGVEARNQQRIGNPNVYQMAYVYPVWEYGTTTFTQNRFF